MPSFKEKKEEKKKEVEDFKGGDGKEEVVCMF